MKRHELTNGTSYVVGPDWVCTTLPNGAVVEAHPEPDSYGTAARLGYGSDVAAMCRQHDPLHNEMCDWIGMPYSYSLMQAAGHPINTELSLLEEDAVIAVQALCVAWDKFKEADGK